MATIRYRLQFNKNSFEIAAWAQNKVVCGVDEVGRGCLAGPVVVAAVILHPQKLSRLVKDSKILDSEGLLKAYAWIIKNSWYTTALVNNRTIDAINIYQATLVAMKRSVVQLLATVPQQPHCFLIDAMPLKLDNTAYHALDVYHFPFGESKSTSIAAASIVAKVTRDALMRRLDTVIPGYHLSKHKGYATPLHRKSVQEMGHSIAHRTTFLRQSLLENDEYEQQQTLW